jgi:hypothetical protein
MMMADTPISDLPDAIGLGDDDYLLLSVGNANYKITGRNLRQAMGAGADGGAIGMIFTAKGDLLAGRGPDSAGELPVGADGEVLTADSTAELGVVWVQPPVGLRGGVNPQDVTDLTITTTDGNLDLVAEGTGDINLFADNNNSVLIGGDHGVVVRGSGDGGVVIDADGTGDLRLDANSLQAPINIRLDAASSGGHHVIISGLPTSNPNIQGALWDSGGTVKISQ